jgi:hypothetical protein
MLSYCARPLLWRSGWHQYAVITNLDGCNARREVANGFSLTIMGANLVAVFKPMIMNTLGRAMLVCYGLSVVWAGNTAADGKITRHLVVVLGTVPAGPNCSLTD